MQFNAHGTEIWTLRAPFFLHPQHMHTLMLNYSHHLLPSHARGVVTYDYYCSEFLLVTAN